METLKCSVWASLLCACCLYLAGCSNSLTQPTYVVEGEITLDSTPLAGATIVFHPVDKSKFKWDERPQAISDEKGRFKLFTYTSNDGAPAGEYKVGVAVIQTGEDGEDQVKRVKGLQKVPLKYGNPETSGLKVTVKAEPNRSMKLELVSK